MASYLARKFRTLVTLARQGRAKEILLALTSPIVRLSVYRLDCLEIRNYRQSQSYSGLSLECVVATPRDMEDLFRTWPDSKQAAIRYAEVYYDYGLDTCLLFRERVSREPVHFHFLICNEHIEKVRRMLPWKVYHHLAEPASAYQEWVYTFERFRKTGVSIAAMDDTIDFCRKRDIRLLYSHRGLANTPSVRMADRMGFRPVALIYQFQFLRQEKDEGIHFVREQAPIVN